MATNRTMLMAMGKLGKKSAPPDNEEEPAKGYGDDEGEEGDGEEEPDADKKTAFVDMCKAIRAGDDDKAYELYQDLCEGM